MPVCYVTTSDKVNDLTDKQKNYIRKVVARGLDSKSRKLDENHVSLRVIKGDRRRMLADIEVEIFAQLYIRRLFSRDKRANAISEIISKSLGVSCASWINLQMVGYSRVTPDGGEFFSDSENKIVALLQKLRGISTKKH